MCVLISIGLVISISTDIFFFEKNQLNKMNPYLIWPSKIGPVYGTRTRKARNHLVAFFHFECTSRLLHTSTLAHHRRHRQLTAGRLERTSWWLGASPCLCTTDYDLVLVSLTHGRTVPPLRSHSQPLGHYCHASAPRLLLPGGLGRAGDMAIPVEEAIAALSTFSLEVRASRPFLPPPASIPQPICES